LQVQVGLKAFCFVKLVTTKVLKNSVLPQKQLQQNSIGSCYYPFYRVKKQNSETPIQLRLNTITDATKMLIDRDFCPFQLNEKKNQFFSTNVNINYKVLSPFNSSLVQIILIRFVQYCD
jgi:hypothetical protein